MGSHANARLWGAAGWLLAVVVWLTAAPFVPRVGSADVRLLPGGSWETAANVLLFAPFALVLSIVWRGRRDATIRVTLIVSVLSLLVEIAQLFHANRVASPFDLAANTAGAWFTATLAGALLRRNFAPRPLVALTVIVVWTFVLGHLAYSAVVADRQLRLANWESDFPIVAADESGGGRALPGRVDSAVICARLGADMACAAPDAPPARRQRLARWAVISQDLVLEARIWLDHPVVNPEGVRIVTFSADPDNRNVTLGLQPDFLILRARTPMAGPNGSWFQFGLPYDPLLHTWIPLEARFRPTEIVLIAGEPPDRRAGRFRFDPLNAWIVHRPVDMLTPALLRRAGWTGAALIAFPVGLILTAASAVAAAAAITALFTFFIIQVQTALLTPGTAAFLAAAIGAAAGFGLPHIRPART